ncbi:MAG: YqaJ viral recombinase family protein [Pseudohongiellaceae bacterium]
MKQQSDKWFEARRGMITASNAWRILGKKETLETYAREIAGEIEGRKLKRGRLNAAAEAGKEWESKIVAQLQIEWAEEGSPMKSLEVNFAVHDQLFFVACSPDYCYQNPADGKKYGLEIKCIFSDEKWRQVFRRPDSQHVIQAQFCQWVMNYDGWFVVYAKIDGPVEAGEELPTRVEYHVNEPNDKLLTERCKLTWQRVTHYLTEVKKKATGDVA